MADQNLVVNVGANITNLAGGLDKATKKVTDFVSKTEKGFQSLGTIGKSMTAVGVGISAGLGVAVKTTVDFDTAMRKAGAIAGASTDQFNDMRDAALDLGAKTSKSASEVADAMTELAAKGFDANQVISAMPGIIAAAEASGEDLALTSDTVASALNGFELAASDAGHVADVLAVAANESAAGIQDMQYAFKYSAPIAHSLKMSLEELASATSIMADSGIKGEQAGTTLRGGLVQLLKPAEKTSKLMESLGITVTDSNGKFIGLSGVIRNFQKSMKGMNDTQKLSTLAQIVGTEAASGFLTLMQAGPAKIDKMTKSLENSAGASKETAAKMKAGIGGALEQLSGAFETMAINIGTALVPAITTVAGWLENLANWFNGLSPTVQNVAIIITSLAAGFALLVGPLLILVSMIPAMTAGFGAIAGSLGLTSTALLGIVGVVAGVIVAIVAIGAALVIAYQKVEWFRNMVDAAWAWIKTAWNTAVAFIKDVTQRIISEVSEFINSQLAKIKEFWNTNSEAIMGIVKAYFSAISAYIKGIMGVIKGVFQVVWPIISGIVKIAWGVIKTAVSTGIDLVLGIIRTAVKLLQGDWKGAWEEVKKTIKDIWGNIVDFFKSVDLVQIGKDIINGLIKGISSMGGAVWGAVKGVGNSIKDGFTSFFKIHSPSRVMRDEVGYHIGTGVAKGIERSTSVVKRASEAQARAALSAQQSAIKKINSGVLSANNSFLSKFQALNKKLTNDIRKANDEYKKALADRENSIYNQVGLFDKVEPKKVTKEDLTANLKDQVQTIQQFTADIAKIGKNAPKGFVDELREMGINSAAEINAISRMSKPELDAYIKMWKQKHAAAKTEAATQMTGLKDATIKKVNELRVAASNELTLLKSDYLRKIKSLADQVKKLGAMKNSGKVLGKNTVAGIIEGLNAMTGALKTKAKSLASVITQTIKKALKIHSPSRLMRDLIGANVVAGVIRGMEGMKGAAVSTAENMAEWVTPQVPNVSMAYSTPTSGAGAVRAAFPNEGDAYSHSETINLERMFAGANITLANGYDTKTMMRDAYTFAQQRTRGKGRR
ncbi:phage tail tape measure protein [Heyndrickxia sporothermodurans]|uniref:phage tail tape measure protein n=1 Tax=Heyndrickxia sporothermodurans TaxID=46224 RepID=UPI002E1D3F89|nr:phage tail tape measure protein [Heyndrickxia sporothermodurans]MED3649949.1 phage tail tape measure protein [Heyndrickxia sporothermodurans]MED3697935.1 phage tail tape measure protein [Heyndrickxia sporothermodurans]